MDRDGRGSAFAAGVAGRTHGPCFRSRLPWEGIQFTGRQTEVVQDRGGELDGDARDAMPVIQDQGALADMLEALDFVGSQEPGGDGSHQEIPRQEAKAFRK